MPNSVFFGSDVQSADKFRSFVRSCAMPTDDTQASLDSLCARLVCGLIESAQLNDDAGIGTSAMLRLSGGEQKFALWRSELSYALSALAAEQRDSFLAHIGFILSLSGVVKDWTLTLQKPIQCYMAGCFFLAREKIDCLSFGNSCRIESRDLVLEIGPEGVRALKGDITLPAATLNFGTFHVPVYGVWATSEETQNLPLLSPKAVALTSSLYRDVEFLQAALSKIHSVHPAYSTWVGRSIKLLVMPRARDGMDVFSSCSYPQRPGLVMYSFGDAAAQNKPWWLTAADLIHEASHQYLQLFERFFPTDSEVPEVLYYSAFTGTKRPPRKVLLALHAAANMSFFLSDVAKLMNSSIDDLYGAREILNAAKSLAAQIGRHEAFTNAGRVLFQQLAEPLSKM